ncbi:MAG: polysaccharide biosynthesis tyrosine autokinase [Halioglobus sp.]|nr:polysaccharide biosynthesis tyrosine autokinase [Halioglobus sp.]
MQAAARSSEPNPHDGDAVDLHHLWRVIRHNLWGILGLCLVVSLLTALWVMRISPVYRASTTIMIESQEAKTVSIEEVYGQPPGIREYFLTQFEIIKNRDIAEMVADELDLWNNPLFAPAVRTEDSDAGGAGLDTSSWLAGFDATAVGKQGSAVDDEERRRAAVINRFMSQLSVEPVEFTQLVVVSFESTDRKLAAEIVNTLARVYIQSQLDAKLQSTREAGNWLTGRLQDLKAKLDASQQALQSYRDREEILDMAGGQTVDAQELNELTTRLGDARRVRIGAENVYRELGGSASYSVEQLMQMPVVLQHPLVQSLAQNHTSAQQEVANLAKRYGPEHPKMMAANTRAESAEHELKQQVMQVAAGIEKEYRVAQRNEQILLEQLAAVKDEVATSNRKQFRLRELEQQVEADERLYEMFFNRAKETSETLGFQSAHARVVERATPPISPIKPNKRNIVLIAFLVSALVGIGLAILRDMLDNTLKSPDEVVERLGAPLLGVLPDIKVAKGSSGPYLGYLEDNQSAFAESIRSVRTGLMLTGLENPHRVTVVTSTNPGEGKSTVAINLAAALAQMETVLLIDADLRRPSVAAAFKLPSGAPGLSNVLGLSAQLHDCVQKTDAGFDVLPAGILPPNPQEMLATAQFRTLVQELAQQYDRIVIDSAPINAVSDSLILATVADSLVYVAKADETPLTLVLKNINLIKHSNLPLTGVVLNRLDTRKQRAYGTGSYYGTYEGYGKA